MGRTCGGRRRRQSSCLPRTPQRQDARPNRPSPHPHPHPKPKPKPEPKPEPEPEPKPEPEPALTLSPPLTQAGTPVEERHRHHGRVVRQRLLVGRGCQRPAQPSLPR
eukprot:scaffold81129_cov56-Phaeocystis_antarctica.AAC.4